MVGCFVLVQCPVGFLPLKTRGSALFSLQINSQRMWDFCRICPGQRLSEIEKGGGRGGERFAARNEIAVRKA